MQLTTNYKLKKPEGTDNVNVDDFNHNADIIDEKLHTHTHTKTQITDMPTSLKNPNALTISLNGTSQGAYDGSSAKTVNVTKESIGLGNVTNESKATMLTSPAMTGAPTAPTPATSTNNTQVATTAFVQNVASGKANSSHTHNSASITDMPTSMKNPNALTVQFNGSTNKTYDGSSAQTLNVTPAAIGAAASTHTHDDRYYTESEINSKLDGKANTSHNHTTMSGDNSGNINVATGNDASGLGKKNNIDIGSWYGISFSNTCAAAGIQGKPSASIDVRTGNAYFAGDIFVKGQSTGLFQSVSDGKSSIANAITGKGVGASGNDTFATLASKIGQIPTGYKFATGNATVDADADSSNRFYISTIKFPFANIKYFACKGSMRVSSGPTTTKSTYNIWSVYSADISKALNYSYQNSVESIAWNPNKIAVGDTNIHKICHSSSVEWYAIGN